VNSSRRSLSPQSESAGNVTGRTRSGKSRSPVPSEQPANDAFYAAAAGPKSIWKVPGSGHIGGIDAQPNEYERRVIAFFDGALLEAK
jgi:hypothetical protein